MRNAEWGMGNGGSSTHSAIRPVLIILIPMLLMLSFPYIGYAEVSAEGVMDRLQTTYREVKDITADFTQRSSIQGFEERVFEGRLYLKKPGMVRWDYLMPVSQKIFIRGDKVILYLPEEKQAIVQTISDHPDAEPAMGLLSDIEKWQEIFDIKVGGDTLDIYKIELHPKAMLLVDKVQVEIDKKSFYITGMSIFEKSGNRVTFNFSNIKSDSGLKESLFDFKIPRGVEVLEY